MGEKPIRLPEERRGKKRKRTFPRRRMNRPPPIRPRRTGVQFSITGDQSQFFHPHHAAMPGRRVMKPSFPANSRPPGSSPVPAAGALKTENQLFLQSTPVLGAALSWGRSPFPARPPYASMLRAFSSGMSARTSMKSSLYSMSDSTAYFLMRASLLPSL